jgi:hypothetical protein
MCRCNGRDRPGIERGIGELIKYKSLGEGVGIPYPVGFWYAEGYYDKTPGDPPVCCGVLFSCNKKKQGN